MYMHSATTYAISDSARAVTSSSSCSAAATGVEVLHAIAEALGQLLRHDHCPHGEAIAYGLPKRHYVGYHRLQLEAPELAANPPKPTLDLQTDRVMRYLAFMGCAAIMLPCCCCARLGKVCM